MLLLNRNLPTWERLLRLLASCALGIAGWAWISAGPLFWLSMATAVTLAASALAGFCPACALFGRRLPGGRG